MRLLLDTHALVWWLTNNPRLAKRPRDAIADPINHVHASAASGYEIAYKQALGKLPGSVGSELPRILRRERLPVLPVGIDEMVAAALLPGPHRDPWDRIIMAQAKLGQLEVVTVDPVFARYGIPVYW